MDQFGPHAHDQERQLIFVQAADPLPGTLPSRLNAVRENAP